jgi:hypothetical protein
MPPSAATNFIATGPAAIGFETKSAAIQNGAEVTGTILGAQGTGPTGVIGQSTGAGPAGVIAPGVGVLGRGDGGPGGKFTTVGLLDAQLNLQPYPQPLAVVPENVQPQQFVNKVELPRQGTAGDFYLRAYELAETAGSTSCALWLCVTSSTATTPAIWRQVLLGSPNTGFAV